MKTLILVDIQNDFLPGGALPVTDGDTIIPIVNALLPEFDHIIATQDFHPAGHKSFAASHPGRNVYDMIDLDGLPQVLWPVHCVANTGGACFAPGLNTAAIHRVFPKGTNPAIDSYSGFFDNGHRQATGLGDYLKEQGITAVTIVGLATDYCVKFTALDAARLGLKTTVLRAACRGVNLNLGDVEQAYTELKAAGVEVA